MRKTINKKYINEKANRSSKACGPLVQWVYSRVKFARLLDSVEPMQKEIKDLRARLKTKQEQGENLQKTVQKITELKNEMKIVQDTLARAVSLLADLR